MLMEGFQMDFEEKFFHGPQEVKGTKLKLLKQHKSRGTAMVFIT